MSRSTAFHPAFRPAYRPRRPLAISACALLLVSCGGGGGDAGTPGSGDPPIGGGNGTLRVLLTDAPACGHDNIFVTVDEVRVHTDANAADSATGWRTIDVDPPRRIDLLTLGNGLLTELGRTSLPAGRYAQLRLVLADNAAVNPLANAVKPTGGSETALSAPAALQAGLKLQTAIDVASGRQADYVLDFDACDSVVPGSTGGTVGPSLLKPVLRGLPLMTSGVQGHIATALVGPQTSISLQQGGRTVKAAVPDSSGAYVLSPVVPGNYQLVLTAPGRTTLVVINVPVIESTLSPLGSPALPLTAPASPTATLTGTVVTGTTPVNASAHALQPTTEGFTVQMAGKPVAANGSFSLVVPTAAPLVAAFVPAPGAMQFRSDTAAAARYTLAARSGLAQKTAGPIVVVPGGTTNHLFNFP